jgi:hypothetical protein
VSAVKDMTGLRFGKLTVLERAGTGRKGQATWHCLCDCGRRPSRPVWGAALRSGHTRSCGCVGREKARVRALDMKGRRFGRLLVLEQAGRDSDGAVTWRCECSCGGGKFPTPSGKSLRSGNVRSCGCLRKDRLAAVRADLTGQRFGKLTVLGRAGVNRCGKTEWDCACDCGGAATPCTSNLHNGTTRSCGCLHREAAAMNIRAQAAAVKHGHTKGRTCSPEYTSFKAMHRRCESPSCKHFPLLRRSRHPRLRPMVREGRLYKFPGGHGTPSVRRIARSY